MTHLDKLKRRINSEWAALGQAAIERASSELRQRLRACISVEGGHIEHML